MSEKIKNYFSKLPQRYNSFQKSVKKPAKLERIIYEKDIENKSEKGIKVQLIEIKGRTFPYYLVLIEPEILNPNKSIKSPPRHLRGIVLEEEAIEICKSIDSVVAFDRFSLNYPFLQYYNQIPLSKSKAQEGKSKKV
ncbi:hypothetical protein B6U80_00855 [Candidatus Pacearchaeota archaeon ex4484_26]|nr:MAG: hypothetical protein B6U80_00855 [Candidatus Pacearchaeota archaeon ex4484_26]